MEYQVKHEGQVIPVPVELGQDEGKLRRALSGIIPGIAEARINKSVAEEMTTFDIVKTAGTKGAAPLPSASPHFAGEREIGGVDYLAHLREVPGKQNAVFECYEKLKLVPLDKVTAEAAVKMESVISKALEIGEEQREWMRRGRKGLVAASAVPAPFVVTGF